MLETERPAVASLEDATTGKSLDVGLRQRKSLIV
jgi:hypothetical protein